MELLWFYSRVGELLLFKLTVIQHAAKSQTHDSETPSGSRGPALEERVTTTQTLYPVQSGASERRNAAFT